MTTSALRIPSAGIACDDHGQSAAVWMQGHVSDDEIRRTGLETGWLLTVEMDRPVTQEWWSLSPAETPGYLAVRVCNDDGNGAIPVTCVRLYGPVRFIYEASDSTNG